MLMTDGQIKEAIASGKLRIMDFSEASLEPASYDMRVGNKMLISTGEAEVELSRKGSATLDPGAFALVTTHEKLALSDTIAGHIGVKSYYTRKGMVMLTGLQIDPGFEGVLVIGLYNASPRSLTLDYLAPFCTVEFYQLARPVEKTFRPGDEQREGSIPRADKDYLRTLETESLSEMSKSIRQLTMDVASLSHSMRTVYWVMGVGFTILSIITALK